MSVGLWAIETQDDNRTTTGQSRAAPRSFSSSCSLIINIILTDFNDAPNSSEVKQCALSVPGYEHSAPHKNNLTTLENNPIFRDWRRIPVAQITSREYSSTYITKVFTAYYLVRVESNSRFNQLQTTLQRTKLDSRLKSWRLLRKNKYSRVHRAQCSNSHWPAVHDNYERCCRTLPSLQGQFTDVCLLRLFNSSRSGYMKIKLVRNFSLLGYSCQQEGDVHLLRGCTAALLWLCCGRKKTVPGCFTGFIFHVDTCCF